MTPRKKNKSFLNKKNQALNKSVSNIYHNTPLDIYSTFNSGTPNYRKKQKNTTDEHLKPFQSAKGGFPEFQEENSEDDIFKINL